MRGYYVPRAWFALAVLVWCGWLIPRPGGSQNLPDTIDQVRPTVIRVVTVCGYETEARTPEHSPRGFSAVRGGTGFWVSDEGFLLTAAHVVDSCPVTARGASNESGVLRGHRLAVGLALPHTATDQTQTRENFTFVDAEIIDSDRVHDVALLRALQNPFRTRVTSGYTLNGMELELGRPRTATLSTRKIREGESIAISGYPLDQSVFDTNAGIVASAHSSKDFELPTYFNSVTDQARVRVDFDLYECDMRVNHGNSGGPVYAVSSGEVIGICSAFRNAPLEAVERQRSDSYNSGLAVIVPIAYGTILMSKHGITIPQPGVPTQTPGRR